MRRRLLSVSLVVGFLATLAWGGPASAAEGRSLEFRTHLTGGQEVPERGDRDGVGNAVIEVGPGQSICYRVVVRRVDQPVAAHIHIGVRGEPGPVVVTLEGMWMAREDGSYLLNGCVSDPDAATIRDHPMGFYVNVHTAAFPNGAVRGQLP